MEQLPQTQPQTNKYKFILNLENPILSNLNYEEKTSRDSFSNTPPTSRRADKDIYFYKTIETLSKSGEQRNPKDIRILMKSTENFQYFLRLKENPATSVLHSRFCRVMKLKHLRKGDTLFYAGDIADQFYIILKGRVLIYIPKQSYNILEERKKNLYEAENIEKCLKSMKKLITGKKNQEGGLHLVSYKTNAILPRRSTILDFSRRTLTANNRELISNSNFIKDQIKRSFSEVDPMYKSVLKITLFETIKIEDLDAPWNYFTDGVLHYDVANVLKEGDYFGELGLLTKKPRKATVLAIEDCYLIYLEKEDYKNVVQSVDMGKINRKIWFFEKFFLTGFTNESILKLSYFFVKKKFTLNQIIFSEGESIDGCFLIKKGEITLHKTIILEHTPDEKDIHFLNKKNNLGRFFLENEEEKTQKEQDLIQICTIGRGEFFGEEDFLLNVSFRNWTAISKSTEVVVFFGEKEMIKRILLSSPKIHESFFSKAKSKNIWYKKQTKLIETQKIKAMKQRYNSSYEHIKKSASLHDFINVRTSAEDIRVGSQQKEQATLVKKFDSFSLLKNNTIRGNSLENNKSKILDYGKQESQSEKISKVIEHNKAFESRLLTSSKNSFHFDIISSYFNTKKLKNFCFPNKISSFHSNFNMCETDMIKKENKLNIKLNSEQCMGNLLERVMSSTFYGHKNKKNIKKCATSRNFYQKNSYNLNENGENMKNEESFTNNEQKNRINIYRIHGESQTKKIDNLNKEKFQMLIRNSHQTNSMVRKTRHRQFFIVQNNLKRAMSVPLKR